MEFIRYLKVFSLQLYLIEGLLLGLSFSAIGQSTSHLIGNNTNIIDGTGLFMPGDTLYLQSGQRGYFLFKNIHGTDEKPITIINLGGQVEIITSHYYGIKFDHCSFIKLSGTGDSQYKYGIKISYVERGTGLSIDNLSTDFEVENLEIANIPIAGIYVKTEPTCTLESIRGNFTMYNIKIHDCYLHEIIDEGFYIGSSKYLGQLVEGCGILLPHLIDGVEIYNNIVENTGWDGIQVSSTVNRCKIYNNVIRNDSYRGTDDQMSGILIGGGSNCDCYNNKIFDGKGDGIDILGLGNHKIYNNLIVRAGKTYHPYDSPTNFQKHGIWVGDIDTQANAELLIYNNTIISPKTFGIKLTNTRISSYKIYNNIVADPDTYEILTENSFLNISSGISNYILLNNLFKPLLSDIKFQNEVANDYDLKIISPAIDAGLNLTSLSLNYDIDNRPRPYGSGYDIGAYESQESMNGIRDYLTDKPMSILQKVIPNPVNKSAIIKYDLPKATQVNLYIVDELGRIIKQLVNEYQRPNTYQIEINKAMFNSGFYFLILECDLGRFTEKLVII